MDGDDDLYMANPWFWLFVSAVMAIGAAQAAISGQVVVTIALAVFTLIMFGITYVCFDRKRDT